MRLRLKFPPIPENAANLADLAVGPSREFDGVELDYSPATLAHVDKILGQFHAEGLSEEQIGETVFSFGCYLGEVLVRNNKGVWTVPDASLRALLAMDETSLMVVSMPDGNTWNPIGKAFKLLKNGQSDSVAYFYAVAIKGV